jgi:hypothetical protein
VLAVEEVHLAEPMPCSPVQVPSIASARIDQALVERARRASSSSGRRVDQQKPRWKLPSPTWPTIGAMRKLPRCPSRLGDALGEPRDRHAHVGGPDFAAGRSALEA